MITITQEQKDLQSQLVSGGISKPYAHQLATGRRTPSMKTAARLHRDLGISPLVWIDLKEKRNAANDR